MCSPLQVVSYAKFLYPTNALVTQKTDGHGPPATAPAQCAPGSAGVQIQACRCQASPRRHRARYPRRRSGAPCPPGQQSSVSLNPQPSVETEAAGAWGRGVAVQDRRDPGQSRHPAGGGEKPGPQPALEARPFS